MYQGDERFYKSLLMPVLHRLLDAESAHELAISLAKYGLVPRGKEMQTADASLLVSV